MNCRNCGYSAVSGSAFCANCGVAVTAAQAPASQEQPLQQQQYPPQYQQQYQQFPMAGGQPVADRGKYGQAIASLVLGIISMITWLIPLFGFPTAVAGLILGIGGLKSSHKAMAIIGIVLSSLALLATLINAAIGAYQGATGQHSIINMLNY